MPEFLLDCFWERSIAGRHLRRRVPLQSFFKAEGEDRRSPRQGGSTVLRGDQCNEGDPPQGGGVFVSFTWATFSKSKMELAEVCLLENVLGDLPSTSIRSSYSWQDALPDYIIEAQGHWPETCSNNLSWCSVVSLKTFFNFKFKKFWTTFTAKGGVGLRDFTKEVLLLFGESCLATGWPSAFLWWIHWCNTWWNQAACGQFTCSMVRTLEKNILGLHQTASLLAGTISSWMMLQNMYLTAVARRLICARIYVKFAVCFCQISRLENAKARTTSWTSWRS